MTIVQFRAAQPADDAGPAALENNDMDRVTTYYSLWYHLGEKAGICLDRLVGVERDFELRHGVRLSGRWPANPVYWRDEKFRRRGTKHTDSLFNTDSLLVVSQRLADLIERYEPRVERLPVALLAVDGTPHGTSLILNPLENVDCVDLERSEPTFYASNPTEIMGVKTLTFDEHRIPADRALFRVQRLGEIVVRRDLANAIMALRRPRATGVAFIEPALFGH